MKKVIVIALLALFSLVSVSFAGQSCVYDMQCGYDGVCIKRQGHIQGYCSN